MTQSGAFSTLKEGAVGTPIALNDDTLKHLNSLVFSTAALKRAGYVVEKLTDSELEQKRRCMSCGIRIGKPPRIRYHNTNPVAEIQQPKAEGSEPPASEDATHPGADIAKPRPPRCNFHPGKVVYKTWTCCKKHVSEDPCTGKEDHDVQDDRNGTNEKRWQFHPTASGVTTKHRVAVAIDCEMGTAFDGESELIRLTVVDYFTGKALIDSLVYPDIPMKHFNTRWSGITRGDMERSRRERKCIMGRDAARTAIFRYVGPSTIVVGHGAQSDLLCLRWIHHRVVDSLLVESAQRKEAELKAEEEKKKKEEEEARQRAELMEGDESDGGVEIKEGGEPGKDAEVQEGDKRRQGGPGDNKTRRKNNPDGMSLKALAMKHLGRAIQVGKKGHDSLEDALAARDLVHAYITGLASSATLIDVSTSGKAA
ncbi:uncharacterized protein B0H64DRAFT_402899 [Chaetomium fimeti]|uniref:Exonuclease domain-containing protein n=1 Tax=Chaetomium fimeti TaxID=1854472 RepID=A0AAE0LPA4_9PEZI|nr:hypothetical protein B0H64DRAFT_402899 [Chaetomium fimeti]